MDGLTLLQKLKAARTEACNNVIKAENLYKKSTIHLHSLLDLQAQLAMDVAEDLFEGLANNPALQQLGQTIKDHLSNRDANLSEQHELLQDVLEQIEDLQPQKNKLERALVDLFENRQMEESRILEQRHTLEDFVALSQQQHEQQDLWLRVKDKAAQAKNYAMEREEVFKRNAIFSYLIKKGYGDKKARGLDRWVAKVGRFDANWATFDRLKALPDLLEANAEELKKNVEMTQLKMNQIDELAVMGTAIQALKNEEEEKGQALTEINDQLQDLHLQKDTLQNTIDQIMAGKDLDSQAILEFLQKNILNMSKQQQLELARNGQPQLFNNLEKNKREIESAEGIISSTKNTLNLMNERQEKTEQLVLGFRQRNYHRARARFSPELCFDDLLVGFLKGNISAKEFWVPLIKAYYCTPPTPKKTSNRSVKD